MMMAALLAPVDAHSPLLRPRTAPGTTRATTPRDRVLDEAIRLFRQHGYAAVSVEAIGTAAGLDQSSVYRHYTGKDEILATALEAGATRLDAGVSALKSAVSPAEELELLVASYVDTALADRDLIAVWLAEAGHLTGDASRRARARQRAYIAVWERAMRTRWPQLAPAEAALTTRAVLSLVNACVSLRRHRGLTNDRLRQLLTAMSFACLSWGGEGRGRHRRTRISALDLVDPDRPANARHA
jgi:AcrR family transcriptional regulator